MVRMEWTFEEFFDNGGTTEFIDRVAGSLGIHASTIKIVSVYEGSLTVNYGVENDNEEELAAAKAAQTEAFATGSMDLGAPVLDVAQSVTSDATTKAEATISSDDSTSTTTTTSTSSESVEQETATESIISGGVVTAEGYEPIVITAGYATADQETEREVYIPDVSIVEDKTIIENMINTQFTVDSNGNTVMNMEEQVDTNNKSTVIVAVTVSIVILLCIAYAMRVLYRRMNAEELEKMDIKIKQEEIHMTKMKSVNRHKKKVDEADDVIDAVRDSNMKLKGELAVSRVEEDEFEDQYNPLHDFQVFGIGNDRIGGNQTLQEKMNLADEGSSDAEEDDSDNGNYDVPDTKKGPEYVAAGKKQGKATENADNTLDSDVANMTGNRQTVSPMSGSSGQKSDVAMKSEA